jgi:hypothetical protein
MNSGWRHRQTMTIPAYTRNLARRLPKPALNRGHVQVLALRALRVLGEASTSEILQWTCATKFYRGKRLANHDNRAARRALDRIAVRVRRAVTRGRPWLWRLKEGDILSKARRIKGLGHVAMPTYKENHK